MLQIQNEYGFYGTDKRYVLALKEMWDLLELPPSVQTYYVDWIQNIRASYWTGAAVGVNNAQSFLDYFYPRFMQPGMLVFGGEIYLGWYQNW